WGARPGGSSRRSGPGSPARGRRGPARTRSWPRGRRGRRRSRWPTGPPAPGGAGRRGRAPGGARGGGGAPPGGRGGVGARRGGSGGRWPSRVLRGDGLLSLYPQETEIPAGVTRTPPEDRGSAAQGGQQVAGLLVDGRPVVDRAADLGPHRRGARGPAATARLQ